MGVWNRRLLAAVLLSGQVVIYLFTRKIHQRNTFNQMAAVGPESLLISVVTALFISMVFTMQVARELTNFVGAESAVAGVLMLALTHQLAPVLTAVILAGRVGSAFAAEIGLMQVTQQIDALYMLRTDPITYLVIPRVIACCLMLPVLTVLFLIVGMAGGLLVATNFYHLSQTVFLDAAQEVLSTWDICSAIIKAFWFGMLIAVIGCSWGLTTKGGSTAVGQSTTAAVVTALLAVFVSNFLLSWLMFDYS